MRQKLALRRQTVRRKFTAEVAARMRQQLSLRRQTVRHLCPTLLSLPVGGTELPEMNGHLTSGRHTLNRDC